MAHRRRGQWGKPKQQSRHGFTLIEMLTALVIISTVFLVFCELAVMSVRTNKKADYEFIAAGVAEQQLEAIRQSSFGALVTGTTTQTVSTLPGGQMTIQIGAMTGYITNSMLQIQVLVTWNSSVGNAPMPTSGRVRLDTLISQRR